MSELHDCSQPANLEVALSLLQNLHLPTCEVGIIGEEEVVQCEVLVAFLVQAQRSVLSNNGLLTERRHDELQKREWLPFEEIRLFHSDGLILSVIFDTLKCIVEGHVLLGQDGNLRAENFHELRFLFLEEVDLGVLAQLQSIDET